MPPAYSPTRCRPARRLRSVLSAASRAWPHAHRCHPAHTIRLFISSFRRAAMGENQSVLVHILLDVVRPVFDSGVHFHAHRGSCLVVCGRARALAGNYHSADFESLTFSGSFDGSLQFEAEAEVEDHIPAKSAALSVRPSAQRSAIAISNELFSWRCCPVFCDSEILLAPNERCLFEMLETSAKTFLGWSSRGGRERIVKGLRPGKHSKWALLLGRAGSPWGG